MWGRILEWSAPKRNNERDVSWDWIKRQPIWHTWELGVAFGVGITFGFLIGLVF